ncbi:hypothetical protein SAMN06296273_2694 [Nitrosomonas ureae]|uniref:Peptidase C39-like domain-containing protein n=1 Tax=Nitrosomonas ureae TaxID=44577 RepID=A0A285C2G4_9PROT|nr:hypothetical protein SAMN06296273_2694 [Nitrosomonas ureae]
MKFLTIRRSRVLLFIVAVLLTSCSTSWKGSSVTLEINKNYIEERLCLGMYEVDYQLTNGSGYVTQEYYQLADGRRFSSLEAFNQAERNRYKEYLDLVYKNFRRSIEQNEDPAQSIARLSSIYFLNTSKKDSKEHHEFLSKLGMKPFVRSELKSIRENHLAPIDKRTLKNISSYFVSQSDPHFCWAAALETAFRYSGSQYKQEEFVSALKKRCSAKLSKTASVNQMFFAATDRHLSDGGRWIGKFPARHYATVNFGDLLKAFSPFYISDNQRVPGHNLAGSFPSRNHSSFYLTAMGIQAGQYVEPDFPTEEIPWKTTRKSDGKLISEGKIKLIKSVAELILAINDNYPVIAGFKQSQGGHAVVISAIEFRPGGNLNANNVYELDNRAYLNYVYFLDPTSGPEPIGMSGDYFLENTAFAFYIAP